MRGRDPPAADRLDGQVLDVVLHLLVDGRVEVARRGQLGLGQDARLDLLHLGQGIDEHLLGRLLVAAAGRFPLHSARRVGVADVPVVRDELDAPVVEDFRRSLLAFAVEPPGHLPAASREEFGAVGHRDRVLLLVHCGHLRSNPRASPRPSVTLSDDGAESSRKLRSFSRVNLHPYRDGMDGPGHPSLIHRAMVCACQRTMLPIRTGCGIRPLSASRYTERAEQFSILATPLAVSEHRAPGPDHRSPPPPSRTSLPFGFLFLAEASVDIRDHGRHPSSPFHPVTSAARGNVSRRPASAPALPFGKFLTKPEFRIDDFASP